MPWAETSPLPLPPKREARPETVDANELVAGLIARHRAELERLLSPPFRWPSALPNPEVLRKFGWQRSGDSWKVSAGVLIPCADNDDILAVEDCAVQSMLPPDARYPVLYVKVGQVWQRHDIPEGRAWTPFVVAIGTHTFTCYRYIGVDPQFKAGAYRRAGERIAKGGRYGETKENGFVFEVWPYDEKKGWAYPVDPLEFLRQRITHK